MGTGTDSARDYPPLQQMCLATAVNILFGGILPHFYLSTVYLEEIFAAPSYERVKASYREFAVIT